MYVNVYIPVKSPPLCFPPAGGKPRNTAYGKAVDVFFNHSFLSPPGERCPQDRKGAFYQTYADLTG